MASTTSFEIEQSGAVVTVRFASAEITYADMQEATAECGERLRCHNAQHFIFDLVGVEFLASACLGALVSFWQDVEHVRGRIALANLDDNVAFLFKVTRLDAVFDIYEDAQAAMQAT